MYIAGEKRVVKSCEMAQPPFAPYANQEGKVSKKKKKDTFVQKGRHQIMHAVR